MRRLFYLIALFAFTLISCDKNDQDISTFKPLETNRQVSDNQAKTLSLSVVNSIFSSDCNIKFQGNKPQKVAPLSGYKDVQYIISESNDTLIYVVNFGNNEGFMLMSGDRGSFPIIAFVDSGKIDVKSIDKTTAFGRWIEEKKNEISISLKQPIDTSNVNYKLWEGVDNDSCTVSIELTKTLPSKLLPTSGIQKATGTRTYSTGKATVYPYTGSTYQWGQGTGYNFNAPVLDAFAGCPAVAVGLLCVDYWYPYQYGYMYMPSTVSVNQQNAISLMFRDIGNQIPGYTWSIRGSGAQPLDILTGIKALGYKNAEFRNYDFEIAYQNLSQDRPVLFGAIDPNPYTGGGHIWFCDGYYEMSWKITKTTKFLWWKTKVETWYEYSDYLYMNWGWSGDGNGWYECNDWKNYTSEKSMYVNLYPSN